MKRSLDLFIATNAEVFSKRRIGTVKNVRSAHARPRRLEAIEAAVWVAFERPFPRFSMILRSIPTIAEMTAQMKSLWIFFMGSLRPSPKEGFFPLNRIDAEVMMAAWKKIAMK